MLEVSFLLTLPMAEFRISPPSKQPCKDTMTVQQGGDLLSNKKLLEPEVVLGGRDRFWHGGYLLASLQMVVVQLAWKDVECAYGKLGGGTKL